MQTTAFWIAGLATMSVAVALASAGCKSGGCSANAFKHANPGFCIDPATGFQAKPEEKHGQMGEIFFFRQSDGWNMSVSWGMAGTADDYIKNVKKGNPGDQVVAEESLSGGGYFRHSKSSGGSHTIQSVAKGTKAWGACYMEGMSEKDTALIEGISAACKSLTID